MVKCSVLWLSSSRRMCQRWINHRIETKKADNSLGGLKTFPLRLISLRIRFCRYDMEQSKSKLTGIDILMVTIRR